MISSAQAAAAGESKVNLDVPRGGVKTLAYIEGMSTVFPPFSSLA